MVAGIYPSDNLSSGRFRKRIIYAAGCGDRGVRRGGRLDGIGYVRGRGGRGVGGRVGHVQVGCGGECSVHEKGIEISYFTRYFEYSECAALSNDTRKRITEDPVRTKFLENKKRRTTSSVSDGNDNDSPLISHIITGVQNAS